MILGFMLGRFTGNQEGWHMSDESLGPGTVLNDGLGDWRFRFIQKIQRGIASKY